MLSRPVHELVWASGGRLSLQVTALPADGDPAQVRRAQVRGARVRAGGGETAGDRSPLFPLQEAGPAAGTAAPGTSCGRRGRGAPGLAWGALRRSGGREAGRATCSAELGGRCCSALILLPSAPLHFPNPKHDVIPKVYPPSHIPGTRETDHSITANTHTHTHG